MLYSIDAPGRSVRNSHRHLSFRGPRPSSRRQASGPGALARGPTWRRALMRIRMALTVAALAAALLLPTAAAARDKGFKVMTDAGARLRRSRGAAAPRAAAGEPGRGGGARRPGGRRVAARVSPSAPRRRRHLHGHRHGARLRRQPDRQRCRRVELPHRSRRLRARHVDADRRRRPFRLQRRRPRQLGSPVCLVRQRRHAAPALRPRPSRRAPTTSPCDPEPSAYRPRAPATRTGTTGRRWRWTSTARQGSP